jgi:hypothetical protein
MAHEQVSTNQTWFTADEIESFHHADRQAAAAIIGLLAGIFTLGLLGYIVVALIVDAYPQAAAG